MWHNVINNHNDCSHVRTYSAVNGQPAFPSIVRAISVQPSFVSTVARADAPVPTFDADENALGALTFANDGEEGSVATGSLAIQYHAVDLATRRHRLCCRFRDPDNCDVAPGHCSWTNLFQATDGWAADDRADVRPAAARSERGPGPVGCVINHERRFRLDGE